MTIQRVMATLRQWLPQRFNQRRYLLDQYHEDLTSFAGDVAAWLTRFPVDLQNVEIYFALAELFRRRGEFDKAVTIHQAIEKASLNVYSRAEVVLEIAQDYYAAGVLSHAESLLVRALEQAEDKIARQAFRLWLTILESEQEWGRALKLIEQYGMPGSGGLRLANLYCEYVEERRRQQTASQLRKMLRKVARLGLSARVDLLMAELSVEMNQVEEAVHSYRNLLLRDPRRLNLTLPHLQRLSVSVAEKTELVKLLCQLYSRHPSVRLLEALLETYQQLNQEPPATVLSWVEQQLKQGNSYQLALYWLARHPPEIRQAAGPLLSGVREHTLTKTDSFHCTECGYEATVMAWQCSGCNRWETLYSRYEVAVAKRIKASGTLA